MPHPTTSWQPTRTAAEAALKAFIPYAGADYAQQRNYDLGPGQHRYVSRLSPYLRRRMLLETDVIRASVQHHGSAASERFIQEIVWRGYFKGWLEQRPGIWANYCSGLHEDLDAVNHDPDLTARYQTALSGQTGLACFDHWIGELCQTGYLHNHARMWAASIWIFTLNLPWRLGADLFLRNLLDGDPASNTLSWRWVAGLHTRDKTYLATAENIARFTKGRFTPRACELAPQAPSRASLEEPEGLPAQSALPVPKSPDPSLSTVVLFTKEDCRTDDFPFNTLPVCDVGALTTNSLCTSDHHVNPLIQRFDQAALANSITYGSHRTETLIDVGNDDTLINWAVQNGARQLAMAYIPIGPLRDWLDVLEPKLAKEGIALTMWQRAWDRTLWPHTGAGFFKVKRQIPKLLQCNGIIP